MYHYVFELIKASKGPEALKTIVKEDDKLMNGAMKESVPSDVAPLVADFLK